MWTSLSPTWSSWSGSISVSRVAPRIAAPPLWSGWETTGRIWAPIPFATGEVLHGKSMYTKTYYQLFKAMTKIYFWRAIELNMWLCSRFTGSIEEGRPLFLPCNPPMPGAFVSLHFEGPPGVSLSICEAFVYTDQALPIERCPTFRDQPPGSTATYNGKCYIFYNQQPVDFQVRKLKKLCIWGLSRGE